MFNVINNRVTGEPRVAEAVEALGIIGTLTDAQIEIIKRAWYNPSIAYSRSIGSQIEEPPIPQETWRNRPPML